MNKKLYTEDGWLNYDYIYNLPYTFIFIVGARGIGKSYGALDYMISNYIKFMYLRRTKEQASTAANPLTSDIIKPLKAKGKMFMCEHLTKTIDGLYMQIGEEAEPLPFCYSTALSTASNLRGFNAEMVDCIFFDEFIAQPEERAIREEASAFYNLYETLNRNRELQGTAPIKVIAAANSFLLANPIFTSLGIVEKCLQMQVRDDAMLCDNERSLCVIMPTSRISKAKEGTALYKLTAAEGFATMALKNIFSDDIDENIKSLSTIQFIPLVQIGELCIYKHKSERSFYVTLFKSGVFKTVYAQGKIEIKRFLRSYGYLYRERLAGRVVFENYTCQLLFDNLAKSI